MNKITGFYPRVHVDTSRCSAVGQAGGVLLTETVQVSGVGSALSSALSAWRKPIAVHDPAKVILDLALSLALGGDCPGRYRGAACRARRVRPGRF